MALMNAVEAFRKSALNCAWAEAVALKYTFHAALMAARRWPRSTMEEAATRALVRTVIAACTLAWRLARAAVIA